MDEVISVAGFVVPGTRVDVLLTMTTGRQRRADHQGHPSERAGPRRRPVGREGQGRQAADRQRDHRAGDARSRPRSLALASNQGKIQLALRNTLDTLPDRHRRRPANALLGSRPAPAAGASQSRTAPRCRPTPRSAETVIEGYNGGVRTLLKF